MSGKYFLRYLPFNDVHYCLILSGRPSSGVIPSQRRSARHEAQSKSFICLFYSFHSLYFYMSQYAQLFTHSHTTKSILLICISVVHRIYEYLKAHLFRLFSPPLTLNTASQHCFFLDLVKSPASRLNLISFTGPETTNCHSFASESIHRMILSGIN